MNLKERKKRLESGQVIPIVILVAFAVIGMIALIVDGGLVMAKKRVAQAAADSAALAGASEMCNSTGENPADVASSYAIANGATSVDIQYVGDLLSVTVSVATDSYFSKIFNEESLETTASASAGCFAPAGKSLMPVAWSCRPPVGGGAFDEGKGCQIMGLDWEGLLRPLVDHEVAQIEIPGNDGNYMMYYDNIVNSWTYEPPAQIYIIMDAISTNQETICKEDLSYFDPLYSTAIYCDLNGDGKHDIEGAGNRGWLDLNGGGGGAAEIKSWIRYGFDSVIYPHTWLSGQPGQATSIYQTVEDYRVGDVVMIPVFNAICDDKHPLTNPACMAAAHADPFPPEPPSGDTAVSDKKPMFHIISFAPFYISCVHTKQSDWCPGFELAQDLNPDPHHPHKSAIKDNTPAIEGFFLDNVDLILDMEQQCDVNLGNCGISLVN